RRLRRGRGHAQGPAGDHRRQPGLRVLQPEHRRGRHVGAPDPGEGPRGGGSRRGLARTPREVAPMADKHVEWQDARVSGRTEIAEGIVRLDFEPVTPTPAKPGEHIDIAVTLPDGRHDTRSYSISGAAPDGSYLSISVARPAPSRGGSLFMHPLRTGDTVRITHPLQDFPLRIGASSYVLVAGGV